MLSKVKHGNMPKVGEGWSESAILEEDKGEDLNQSSILGVFSVYTLCVRAFRVEAYIIGVSEQQRRRPACASAQSDQRLCYSLIEKYHI